MTPCIYNIKTGVYRLHQPSAGGVGIQSEVELGPDEILLDADNEVYDSTSGELKPIYKTTACVVRDLGLVVRKLSERVAALERGSEPEPQREEVEERK